jgi:sugar transferase (PEP-CTERM/EpsH1 system associated)
MSNLPAPLVLHFIYRLDLGGLENGLVHLINHTPVERYRHAIVCLTEATEFRRNLRHPDVPVVSLHKEGDWNLGVYRRLWRLIRTFRPAIFHTRNLGTLEGQIVAALAGVPGRIHGVHGRDTYDLDGTNVKYNLFRRAVRPLIHHYTTVSRDLASWLESTIGVRSERITQIYNGVDIGRFYPAGNPRVRVTPEGFVPDDGVVVGAVGRMHAVKDQLTLARAFIRLLEIWPPARERARLVLVGEGPLRAECLALLQSAGAASLAWLPGERTDIPDLMRSMDLFVLPSIGEGISNTILEAMASGLPVLATRVGGNPELVEEGRTGMLVPPSDPQALAEGIRQYLADPWMRQQHGRNGRLAVEGRFNWGSMVEGYLAVYDKVLNLNHRTPAADQECVTEQGTE